MVDTVTKVRLNKYIAYSKNYSRRKADELIKKGYVKINGEKVNNAGTKINLLKDIVEIKGEKIENSLYKKKFIYIALYKPIKE